MLDLSASGPGGSAVSWQVTGASETLLAASDVSLDSYGGILTAGQVQVVTVFVPSGTPEGSVVIDIQAGSATAPVAVTVMWGASPPS
jgi:hypothetical protein